MPVLGFLKRVALRKTNWDGLTQWLFWSCTMKTGDGNFKKRQDLC